MMIRRFIAAALVLGVTSLLGACSPFSGSVADMWPHWAGGEPAGLPPRPGQPGYQEFIAHGQPNQNPPAAPAVAGAPGAAQPAPAGTTASIAEQKSPAAEQKPPAFAEPQDQDKSDTEPVEQPANDSGVVHGGLY